MNLEPLTGPPGKSNALDWELKVPMGGLFQPSVSSIQPSEQPVAWLQKIPMFVVDSVPVFVSLVSIPVLFDIF